MFLGARTQALLRSLGVLVLGRLVAPTHLRGVAAALIVVGFSSIFSQVGVGPALVQCAMLTGRHIRIGFTMSLLFSIFTMGLIFLLAPWIANFFHIGELVSVTRVISLVFVCSGIS